MCLMEKRLSEYVSVALQQTKLIEFVFTLGSVSSNFGPLVAILLGHILRDQGFDSLLGKKINNRF